MIEIPPKFAGCPPVNPAARGSEALVAREWRGARGLAEDVRYYGRWMREEAHKRIGHLYPKVEVTPEMVRERPDLKAYEGRELTVIAWLWARTVKSPNPAFADVDVPLASTFMLSTKKGKEAYVAPVIEGRGYRFTVRVGTPADADAAKAGTKLSRGAFRCLLSGIPIKYAYIDDEANAGRMYERLMAVVVEGDRRRLYLSPTVAMEVIARSAKPPWKPDLPSRGTWASNAQGRRYGFRTFGDYFTPRQLVALTTFSDLVGEAMERAYRDHMVTQAPEQHQKGNPARRGHPYFEDPLPRDGDDRVAPPDSQLQTGEQAQGEPEVLGTTNDEKPLRDGGTGARAYAEAVGVYLACALSKVSNIGSSITSWMNDRGAFRETFARQAIPMVWDFAEANPFADVGGSLGAALEKGVMVVAMLPSPAQGGGFARQSDAASQTVRASDGKVVSADPPYFDNIGYADLSDFFYVWLRRSLRASFPDIFATLAVPKSEELVATPYRHEGKAQAESFFLGGMTRTMRRLAEQAHPNFPVTIYYAFKQSEQNSETGTASTGWEVFLEAVIRAGFSVSGTWPVRTEGAGRIIAKGTNALASSIVLVCRRRPDDAPIATRREYLAALRSELPQALRLLRTGNVAPVDLAQAAIGPGMAVYTRYAKVLDAAGNPLSVRDALALINRVLDEVLAEQEGDFDADSRWAVAWFEQHGFEEGEYGVAETLSKAKNTSVAGLVEAGILASKGGTVRLLKPDQLPEDWDPSTDARLTAWEMVHHLIRVLEANGESAAAELAVRLGAKSEVARELCYRLYTLCERKKRAGEALSYNSLVRSWPEITRLARDQPEHEAEQTSFFATEDGQSGS